MKDTQPNHPSSSRITLACLLGGLMLAGSTPLFAQLPAFPGAEGFGKYATGGRNGAVYFVTTTNDSGAGSFRDAVTSPNRTVIFRVGGVIDYSGGRYNVANNVTIAGQTAPGDGVTLYGDGIGYEGADNTITRFIRFRMGINGTDGKDAVGIPSGNKMIFDHIDASWGRDETFSMNGSAITDITIQSSIISQGLQGHSAGGLIQPGGGVSILRSLYIDNDTRNPKVKGTNEFVNNVVCNWENIGYNMGGESEGSSWANVFNNYFIRGQASSTTAIGGGNANFNIFATNNWYDGDRDGILDGSDLPYANYGDMTQTYTPFAYPISYASAYSPLTALKLAISDVGPSFKRDYVDELMISQLASWGLEGGTITSELIPPMHGPGVIRNGTPYPDADSDGMPDYWENGTGSNSGVANNNDPSPSGSGYTRLEDYLNWLAEPHGIALQNTNVVVDLRQFTRGWVVVNHSPFWSVSNPTNGTVALTKGYLAVFTPTSGLNGPAGFQFTVNDADGGPVTRRMNLFFTPDAQSYTPVWHGDDLANNWNALGDYNWHDGISLLYQFHQGEAVLFDDTGSTNPAVNLIGSLQPASVTINATKSYTLSGSGSLDGTMALNKTNTGTLTINTTNGFTGGTIVSNGTLLVHGSLTQSAVTVRGGGLAGGNGSLGNGLTALSGSAIIPGNGIGAPGTLTITNALTESGGVTNRFDFSDDPTGLVKTNDLIRIVGDLNVSGVNIIKVSLLDGLPGNGVYTLFTYTGAFNGSLANFTVSGVSGALTNMPNAIGIVVNAARPPATLVWKGDGVNNIWDTGTNANWLNDGAADRFYFLDDVLFDNSGSTTPAVNLAGELTPNSVTVDAAVNFTLGGAGKITGTGTLTKTNSGTLTVLTANDYTGATVIGGGVLSVPQLANSGAASGIGAAALDSANLVFFDSTLRYTSGSTASDRGATFNGANAIFDVAASGTTLTWNGTNIGTGALTKAGSGTLTLTAENSFAGGTVVSNGTLALSGPAGGATLTANDYALGSGGVTLYGGILKLFGGKAGDVDAGYGTFSRPLYVPAGATAALYVPSRYTMSSTLAGGGTLNLDVNYVRGSLNGNWSAFSGLINVTAYTSPAEFRVANTYGYAGATVYLNDNVVLTRSGDPATIEIGALGGGSGAIVGAGSKSSSGSSYRVGWNNADATFAGQLQADGVNTFTKVGTGTWTLSGANSYSGGTVVEGGRLMVNNSSGSGTGSGAVTVNTGAQIGGYGIISGALTVNSGSSVSPGAGIGTLTVNNSVTLAGGSTTLIEINKTSLTKDLLSASGTLTYGGSLIVTNLGGTLTSGDSFKIFNGASYAGAFTSMVLPALTSDVMWNTNTLMTSGTINVVGTNFTGPQALLWIGDGVYNLWDTGASLNWRTTNGIARAFFNSDSVTFNDAGSSSPSVNLTTSVTPVAMAVSASQNYTLTGPGGLSGTMSLTKSGAGTLTLANAGANAFTGGTTISGGTLQIGDGAAVSGTLTGNVTNNATLIFNNPGTLSSPVTIRGSGVLVKRGAGTLTLGAQSYTNATVIEAGTLSFSGTPPSGSVSNAGVLNLDLSSAITYSAAIHGTGSVNINASGLTNTFTSGASTYSGGTTNTAGVLHLASNNAIGTGPVTYLAGSVRVGSGAVISNTFILPSSTTDLMMDTFNGGGTWAGDIVASGGASFRPGGTGGTLVLAGTAAIGARNFIVPRGTVEISGSYSASGGTVAFGRNTTGNSSTTRIKQNAVCTFGSVSLGGGTASGGTLTLQIQDNASFTTGTGNLDVHNSTAAAAITVLNLNGGTCTVGGITKTRTGATQYSTNSLNGGTLRASQNNASFLPALSGLTCLVRSGGAKIDAAGYAITVAARLLHDPALGATADGGITKLGAGTLTLSGDNTFTGPTMVSAGTLALSGSIASSTNLYLGAGAAFDASAPGSFTLGSGRTLWGNGSVAGNFAVAAGATLAPGSNGIGRLTFGSSLTLGATSTNRFEISKAPLTNDSVAVTATLNCGGVLIVTKPDAAALAPGDSFKLFNAGGLSSTFSSVQLPSAGAGLAWNTNALYTTGTISVVATVPPAFTQVVAQGTNLVMAGSNGVANGSYYVLASTNVSAPLSNWTRLLTNQFKNDGSFAVTNVINPQQPAQFFLIQVP